MKVKKLLTMCLSAVMLFSLLAVPAFAAELESNAIPASSASIDNNHEDKNFTFNFDFLGHANTTGESKTDTSPTYIVAYSMCNGGFDVHVDGLNTTTGAWVDCTDTVTYGQPHLSTINRPGLISQWVYEQGYRTARLGGYKLFASRSVTGKWSPDSVGSYRYLGSST